MKDKADAMADFLKWVLTDGQQAIESLHYARLPQNITTLALTEIARIQ
jgi:ABC-type phosphate transport system substrate-binding protein